MKKSQIERIEVPVTIIRDREPSDYKPNVAWRFDFKDEKGIEYEWNTTSDPEEVWSEQKWLVRMTIVSENECMGFPFKRVERVKFIKRL